MQFSKDNNAPIYTAGTVHSLKSMKVNFCIFPGQHITCFEDYCEEEIPTSNISKAISRCSFKKNGIKFC
jgi:hypothetical protein